jgi:MraZ protein
MIKGNMILLGQYIIPINNQGQLSLPPKISAALHPHAFLTQGFDRNLLLMSSESFERIYSFIKNTSISDPLARLLVRLFLANAVELNIDDSGLIQIPSNLRELIGASDKMVVVGQGDYFEIWSPLSWDEQTKSIGDFQANVSRFAKYNLAAV